MVIVAVSFTIKKKDNIEILNVFNLFNFNVFFIVKCCCVNQGSWLTQTLGSSSKSTFAQKHKKSCKTK